MSTASTTIMSEDRFWEIIAASRESAKRSQTRLNEDFAERHSAALAQHLRALSPQEVIVFGWRFDELYRRAYRWDLWGAAYWLGGGCSDDGFMDFRSCLISLGKADYYRALENPDSLVDTVDRADTPYMQAEIFQYVASQVYREKTGEEALPESEEKISYAPEPRGERFDFDDEALMAAHYPNLVARLPEGGD